MIKAVNPCRNLIGDLVGLLKQAAASVKEGGTQERRKDHKLDTSDHPDGNAKPSPEEAKLQTSLEPGGRRAQNQCGQIGSRKGQKQRKKIFKAHIHAGCHSNDHESLSLFSR